MELSRKKQIKRRLLPGFANGLDWVSGYTPNTINGLIVGNPGINTNLLPKGMPWFTTQPALGENKRESYGGVNLPAILGFGADVYGLFLYNKTPEDMIMDAGTSTGSIGGIGYTRYNPVNVAELVSEVQRSRDLNTLNLAAKGATVGSTFGPVGAIVGGTVGLFGGILGGHKQKEEAEETAKRAAVLTQGFDTNLRAGAHTKALLQDYALYGAAEGKDETPFDANALVKRGESVLKNLDPLKPQDAVGKTVDQGSGKRDDVPTYLGQRDVVLGEDINWETGISFKKEAYPYTKALEYINKKYESDDSTGYWMHDLTKKLQQEQVNKLKQPIVEKLKDLADQQKYQHDITGYNQLFMAARGKDRTVPPVLGPSTAALLLGNYLYAAGDRSVAKGRLGKNETEMHRLYTKDSGKDLYEFGKKHKNDYKSLPKRSTVFNPLEHLEYYQQYLDAVQQYPTVDDYVEGEMNNYRRYWEGKKENAERRVQSNPLFNRFAGGKDYHTIPNVFGALASIGQMIQAGKQEMKTSDSFAPHQYADRVADTLASIDINEQPGLQQINKAARLADYGIINSGGLSGSQKHLARLANANNVYTNYLKFLFDSQAQKNAYRAQYANALASLGSFNAQNRQNANQWDLDYYSKAHAARQQGIQMGLRNLMDYVNQWSADASKRYQFNKMYDLYAFDTYNNANKYRQ